MYKEDAETSHLIILWTLSISVNAQRMGIGTQAPTLPLPSLKKPEQSPPLSPMAWVLMTQDGDSQSVRYEQDVKQQAEGRMWSPMPRAKMLSPNHSHLWN